ncbi:MAG: efflux RND transporter permease subunit [Nitrospirae bacterium]|nr:efflux RND transporter permease subunit [Nitrospirota bacterium]
MLLTMVLALLGGLHALKMPTAIYPSIDFPRVSVIVLSPNVPFHEMESRITRPVGMALRSVRGVREVRSRTMQGSAEFFLRFSWTSPMRMALPRVGQAIDRVRSGLPGGTQIRALRMYPSDTPVLGIAFFGPHEKMMQMTEITRYRIVPFLSNLPGVWKAEIMGSRTREVHVEVDPYKLSGVHRTMQNVIDALAFENRIGVVGRSTGFHRLKTIQVNDVFSRPEDIRSLFIPGTIPVPLREVANVREGIRPSDLWVRVSADASPAVLLQVFRAHGGNAITIRQEVLRNWKNLLHLLPPGISVRIYYDQGDLAESAVKHVIYALLTGLTVSLGVVLLFLRQARPLLIVAGLMPPIFLIALGVMDFLGASVNLMSLGGMAAALGLIIDDFIVVVEGGRFRERLLRLMPPFVLSGFLTIVAILPLLGIGGLVGAFFKPLAEAFVSLLAVSLLVNTFVTPFYLDLPERPPQISESVAGSIFFRPNPGYVLALLVVLAIVMGISLRHLSTNFMPRMDEGSFVLNFHAPPGMSLDDTDRIVHRMEKEILSYPSVIATSRRLGAEMGFFITEPNKGDIVVRLSPDRKETIFSVMDHLREWIHLHEPEMDVDFSQVLEDALGDLIGVQAPIVVQIHGQDRKLLLVWASRIQQKLSRIPGMIDPHLSVRPMLPALDVRVDRKRAALFGLTPDSVIRDLRTDLLGVRATTLIVKGIPESVRVVYPGAYNPDQGSLERIPLVLPSGILPLSQIAVVRHPPSAFEEEDLNLSPVLTIEGRLHGRNLGKTIREIRASLARLPLPPSVWLTYSGAWAEERKSFRDLSIALSGGFLLVLTLLFGAFRGWKSPFAIFLSICFSMMTALFSLTLANHSLNISSFVGLILVVGITAENAFLVAWRFRDARGTLRERLEISVKDRFIPLVMTHLATLAALLPLAVGRGSGLDMERSLAVAVIGGLVGSFLSSTFLIPSILTFLEKTSPIPEKEERS